jgi:AAA15 family ATPase/GTPase
MLNRIELTNFGPLTQIDWKHLGGINLVIGANDTGKTFLLKALYTGVRTLEEYKRGNDPRTAAEILADKLHWTFEAEKIGDLVTKGAEGPLCCSLSLDDNQFRYSFGKDTTKQIVIQENHTKPRKSNSIFLPAKEVLSIHNIILRSREEWREFGFDDTYLDLARALRPLPKGGKTSAKFAKPRQNLEEILAGKVEFDEKSGWQFKKGNQKFPIGVTAEGIKKIAILDTLLGNGYCRAESIIFFDEPEAALHPVAITRLLDIVAILAESGIQFFLASHSYFVVKKLFLIAQKENLSIPVISADADGSWEYADLKDGMPDNPIINESIELYKEEVELALQ